MIEKGLLVTTKFSLDHKIDFQFYFRILIDLFNDFNSLLLTFA